MANVIDFVVNYWYVVGVVVLVAAYFLLKHMAKSKAKDTIMKWFNVAEQMVFDSADAKLAYVATAAYAVLPKAVKTMVSPTLFSLLLTQVYDSVKEIVESKQDASSAPAQPDKKQA